MNKSRRSFLWTGAAAVPAALSLKDSLIASPSVGESVFKRTHNILIHPEILIGLNQNFDLVSVSPWAISKRDIDLLPYVLGGKDLKSANEKRFSLDRLASFRILGDVPLNDLVGELNLALAHGQSIDVTLNVNESLLQPRNNHHAVDSSRFLTVSLVRPTHASPGAVTFVPFYIPIKVPIPFTDYYLQFRGPDPGPLSCAREVRRHWHLELWRKRGIGNRGDIIANFHIAVWRSGRTICFAIANSEGRPECFRKCSPTWTDIKNSVQSALIRHGISLAVAAVLAAAIATLIYGSLAGLVLA